jgi:hypothetical protein
MAAIHVLAVIALLPLFWSVPAVASFLVLYWVTACLGVTIGYHRLLSHRSFKVPQCLESVSWLNTWFLALQLPLAALLFCVGHPPAPGGRIPLHLAGELGHPLAGHRRP